MRSIWMKAMLNGWANIIRTKGLAPVKRIIVAVVGGTVLLIGVALVVLPGPAFLVIPLGLGILGTEFVWARRWLDRAKRFLKRPPKPPVQTPATSKPPA